MWKYLAIQGLLFFLFFQPDLVAHRLGRIFLVITGVTVMTLSYLYAGMDPFAWMLYCIGIAFTYLTAIKALRWIRIHEIKMRDSLSRIQKHVDNYHSEIHKKDDQIKVAQARINHISQVYEKLKEMSKSLEFLDVFIYLSEILMQNFSLERSRLILIKQIDEEKDTIDKVYQLDKKYAEFSNVDKNVLSQDVMYRGEVFPFDLRLVQLFKEQTEPLVFWSAKEAKEEFDLNLGGNEESFIAMPVHVENRMNAILILQGVSADDYAAIQILIDRFLSEFKRIQLYEDVQKLAITDWLTGAYVRRHFFRRLKEELVRAKRFKLKFSFLMIDLDDFKSCNDRHGHLVGDAVLKRTTQLIRRAVREVDLVGRYGGEEFAAILLDTDEKVAMVVAERIRKTIEKEHFRIYDLDLRLTASIGFATFTPSIREASEIVEWADSALYQAKRQGKNRVCAYIHNE